MSDPMERLSSKAQKAVVALFILPWVAFGFLTTDVLPVAWQFGNWPETAKELSAFLFSVFLVAETVFSFWYFSGHQREIEK